MLKSFPALFLFSGQETIFAETYFDSLIEVINSENTSNVKIHIKKDIIQTILVAWPVKAVS